MKQIDISTPKYPNTFALVDDGDFAELSKHKWSTTKNGNAFYAKRSFGKQPRKAILMHRVVMDAPKGQETDHQNGNGLDNRRINLRLCTHSQNIRNSRKQRDTISIYKGVSNHKGKVYNGKRYAENWEVRIGYNKKRVHIGNFDSEIEAAKAYDKKAVELFGSFARTNF